MRVTNDCARDQVVNWIGPGPTEQITELNVEHLVLGGDGISGYQNFEDANGVQTPGRCLTLISDYSAAGVQPEILSKKSLIVPAGETANWSYEIPITHNSVRDHFQVRGLGKSVYDEDPIDFRLLRQVHHLVPLLQEPGSVKYHSIYQNCRLSGHHDWISHVTRSDIAHPEVELLPFETVSENLAIDDFDETVAERILSTSSREFFGE